MKIAGGLNRRISAGWVLALVGASFALTPASPAFGVDAATDGPPQINYTTPQVSRTAGGTPIRISGSGFLGTTSVMFGNAPALDFKVVDSNLITATTPSAAAAGASQASCVPPSPPAPRPNNSYLVGACADITLTDNQGSFTGTAQTTSGMFYTDATLTVSPDPIHVGVASVTVSGYPAGYYAALVEMNPLIGFLEGGPDFATSGYGGPPPYLLPLGFFHRTDPNTDLVVTNGHAAPEDGYCVGGCGPAYNFNTWGLNYDPNVRCAPNQLTADYGLSQCMIGFGQFAVGTLEKHVSFKTGQRTPAPPTLALSRTTAMNGDTVGLSGVHWNNNPYFGSDTTPDDPGETQLIVEICNSDSTGCNPVPADAQASLTRYRTSSTTAPVQGVFSGATLSGSLTVANTSGCAPNCLVRVRQEGYNYDAYNGQGTGTYIVASAPLTIGAGGVAVACTRYAPTSGAYLKCRITDPRGIRREKVVDTTTGAVEAASTFPCDPSVTTNTLRINDDGHAHRVVVTSCDGSANNSFTVAPDGTVVQTL